MVSVPVAPGRSVEVQPLGKDRLRHTQPKNLIGPAVEQFGQSMGKAAKDWDAIEATYDEADALRIANEYAGYERERLRTGENAYLASQGFKAGEGMESAVKDIRGGAENLLTGARSDRARMMAKRTLDVRIGSAEEKIATHATGQMTVARNEQSNARISGAITDAIDERGTEQFAVNLGLARMEQAQMGARLGWSPEQLADEEAKLVSNTYSRTVLAIDAEDGEPGRALEFLKANKDAILPDEQARLETSLNPRVDAAWARGQVDDIVNEYIASQPASPVAQEEWGDVSGDPLSGAGSVVNGGQWGAKRSYGGHTGVDYAAPSGTPVRATAPGIVRRAYFDPAYGNRIEVDHGNGVVTTYSHLRDRSVGVGDTVDVSTTLGGVGNTGSASEGNHVHYEMIRDGQKVKPVDMPGAPGVPDDPRLSSVNVQDAIERHITANPGISERRAEALRAAGDQFVSNARSERAQAEQDADRRVMDWLTQNKPGGDDLTDMGQIPAAILQGASPSTMAALQGRIQTTQNRIQSRNDAVARDRADRLEEAAVFELYTLSDQELAKVDMRRYAGRVGLDKLGPWIDRQQRVANATIGNPVSSDRIAAKIDSIGKSYGASRDKDAPDDERRAWIALRGYVESKVVGRANNDLTDEELRSLIVTGMQEVEIPGSGWFRNNRKPRSQVAEGEIYRSSGIPITAANEIKRQMRARIGREPSGDELWSAYQAGKARGIFE